MAPALLFPFDHICKNSRIDIKYKYAFHNKIFLWLNFWREAAMPENYWNEDDQLLQVNNGSQNSF